MNIVFFIQNISKAGGSERVSSLIANYFSDNGHCVTILSISGSNTPFFSLNRNIRLKTLIDRDVVDNRKEFLTVLKSLNSYYMRNSVDVVIDVFPALSLYTVLLKRKYGFKNISWEHYNFLNNTGMCRLGRQVAMRFSDYIVTLTDTDRQLYIRSYKKVINRITNIFNPTPFPNPEVGSIKDNTILAVGRLENQKGFHHLLDIWAIVESNNPNWQLYIIGEGEDRSILEEKILSYNLQNVVLTGRVNNIEEYYKKASLVVSTSLQEGLPMTMIEAQSFGIPIISFDYMTGPRDIITDGSDGYIIEGSNQEEINYKMAHCLLKIMSDNRLLYKLHENAMISRSRFLIEGIGKEWSALLSRITE